MLHNETQPCILLDTLSYGFVRKPKQKVKNYCICSGTLKKKKFYVDLKLNASIGQQSWFQLCKFMEVYSGSYKTSQLNFCDRCIISSPLKFIHMKIYLQLDVFMNLGSFSDET